ncbi:MAG: adenylate/guanylate cyclase domain-containing protein [Candidatus Dormibacteraeota bacterium]|nr:adenylate/guanylate cyclase domain-containing protein [Candidatus Dormibacteraeota bacterium]
MFADIVGSTQLAAEVGDQQWLKLIDRHDSAAHRLVHEHGGRVVKSTGDGMLCTFDLPAEALACAARLHTAMAAIKLSLRIGVHTGEVERRQQDVGGLAVHLCARLCDLAGDGETLVTRTVADVVVGSSSHFEDRGDHALRGIPGNWRLLAVRR